MRYAAPVLRERHPQLFNLQSSIPARPGYEDIIKKSEGGVKRSTSNLIKEINEIRDGILLNSTRQDYTDSWLAVAPHQNYLQAAKDHVQLESLMGLLDKIATSWIILLQRYEPNSVPHLARMLPRRLSKGNATTLRIFPLIQVVNIYIWVKYFKYDYSA